MRKHQDGLGWAHDRIMPISRGGAAPKQVDKDRIAFSLIVFGECSASSKAAIMAAVERTVLGLSSFGVDLNAMVWESDMPLQGPGITPPADAAGAGQDDV